MASLFIEASSIGSGGGVTHIRELLRYAEPQLYGFDKVEIWAADKLLSQLPDKVWLEKHTHPWLNKTFIHRLLWQKFILSALLKKEKYLLFLPSGNYVNYHPYISFCQNLQPFDPVTQAEYKNPIERLRYRLLARSQGKSFREADGVLYLTRYSMEQSFIYTGDLSHKAVIIPHAADSEVFVPRADRRFYSPNGEPFKLLYVSTIVNYKRQDVLIKALAELIKERHNVHLTLIGGWHAETKVQIEKLIKQYNIGDRHLTIIQKLRHDMLPAYYQQSDAFVMASSCETFGITLLEAMQCGLPIICAENPSLLETLGDAGLTYPTFDHLALKERVKELMQNETLQQQLSERSLQRAALYSWSKTAKMTFGFFQKFIPS
jgi:glycosyltransferase involved in cell wall biosynthesis